MKTNKPLTWLLAGGAALCMAVPALPFITRSTWLSGISRPSGESSGPVTILLPARAGKAGGMPWPSGWWQAAQFLS